MSISHPSISRWSPDVRAMVRPYRTYRALAASPSPSAGWRLALRGPLMWALFLGAFVSFTSSGRLVWWHLVLAAVSWAFLPCILIAWLAIASRTRAASTPFARRVDLYFAGFGPWYAWMLVISGICIFAPHARLAFFDVLGVPVFFAMLSAAFAWSAVLTHACFRCGLAFARGPALRRTIAFYLGVGATITGYFVVTGQLLNLIA